jgi:secreted trypsin-like serine protease
VRKIIIHPSYNPATLNNDIALIQLSKPLKFNKKQKTIALPKVNYGSGSVWAVGWGRTETFNMDSYSTRLKHVQLTLRTHAWCEIDYPGDYNGTTMMCADDWPGLESSCNGDSGGGLVGKANGKWVVVGITSWGTLACGLKTNVYTRVSNYAGWIKSKTGIRATG